MKERSTLSIDMDMLKAEAHRAGVKLEEAPLVAGTHYESLSVVVSNYVHPIRAAYILVDTMMKELDTKDILLHNYQVLPAEEVDSTQIYLTATARTQGVS